MYNIKKKNIEIYKIYKNIKKNKKNILLLTTSFGVDSGTILKEFKKLLKKKLIKIINVNHKSIIDKKLIKNIKNIYRLKIKLKNNKVNEIFFRKKRFKKLKNICIKKKNNLWIFQQKNEIIENFIIQKLIKNNKINKFKEYKKKYIIKKIKPINKFKKKIIKYKKIKKKYKWLEEKNNIKYKNMRNKIRINIINIIKTYINKFEILISKIK
ncbi:ATP-binding protein [Candidatus Nasuia deltocephalinicola]|nr:ATP-binding protein [Candidatus Nasuia deltocephalinicola]